MKLRELKDRLSAEITKSSQLFYGLTITSISIDKQISTQNSFYVGTQKEHEKSFQATFIINKKEAQEFLNNSAPGVTNNGSAEFDIVIDKIYISSSMSLMVVAKKVTETGVSQREIQRRILHKYCVDNKIYERRRKTLYGFVLKILAITSKTSSIEGDILNNIGLRDTQGVHILNCTTSNDIAKAINDYSATGQYNLIVLHRGGREDEHMSIFSSREIIDAVAISETPIASALGHEQDKPFITQVTDIDYSTPSAFAKEIKNHNASLINIQRELVKNITMDLKQIVKNMMISNGVFVEKIGSHTKRIKAKDISLIDSSINNLRLHIKSITRSQRDYVQMRQSRINNSTDKIALHLKKETLKHLDDIEKYMQNISANKKHFDEVKALNKKNKQIVMIVAVILIIVLIFIALQ